MLASTPFDINDYPTLPPLVQVGSGSLTTVVPEGRTSPTAEPNFVDDFDGPVAAAQWWSSIGSSSTGESFTLVSHPLATQTHASGLAVGYPRDANVSGDNYQHHFSEDFRFTLEGLAAAGAEVSAYSDWTVTTRWESGADRLEATQGHGLPFIYATRQGSADVQVIFSSAINIWSNAAGVAAVTVGDKHYGLFAPAGSTWLQSGNTLQNDLNGEDYFSVAILPDDSAATFEFYRRRAYAFVTDTQVSWQYDGATSTATATYTATTELKEAGSGNLNRPLMALYRHQWLYSSAAMTAYTYESSRGQMKVLDDESFSTRMTHHGTLPLMPQVGADETQLYTYIDQLYQQSDLLTTTDSYFTGTSTLKLAQLVPLAEQVGHDAARDRFLREVRVELEDWLDADDGGQAQFYYDRQWNSLIGYPDSFGSADSLNDHHFHYGYFIQSAAIVAMYDPDWAHESNWGGMVELLIRDAGNWERDDTTFQFLRHFDIYAGHSWASGNAQFARGNNQESSSEAMNFATGLILWGSVTGDDAIRDVGIFLATTHAAAIQQYWFDVDEAVFPDGYQHPAAGIVWSDGAVYASWFSASPEHIQGINYLPLHAGSLYLGHHPDYVQSSYNHIVSRNGGPVDQWADLMASYLALTDPSTALADFNANPSDSIQPLAKSYHWISSLDALGQVDPSVTADIPSYAVFDKAGVKTYVAYNPTDVEITTTYSDSTSVSIPAKTYVARGGNTFTWTPNSRRTIAHGARIEAEEFDVGGQGVGYQDVDGSNNGGVYRTSEGVDVEASTDHGGGFNVGWTEDGEWLRYTVDVAAGNYNIRARVASGNGNPGDMRLLIGDGTTFSELGVFDVEPTGGWQNWTTLTIENVQLAGGQDQVLRVEMIGGQFNLNWLQFETSVPKTDPTKLYMHYMPWFETPDTLGTGQWGYHWRLNNQDPNIIEPGGQRQIASHFYPLIEPYASSDADVIEYHLLLMKLAGVDGVLIDWYGVEGSNGDIGRLLTNSNALVDHIDEFGLEFGVVLEDRFASDIDDTKANMAYLRDNYFNHASYIRQGSQDDPLVLVFGPITFEQESQWTEILGQAGEDVQLLPLWYQSDEPGTNADGEFAWVFEDEAQDDHLQRLANFYQNRAPTLDTAGGSVYPGFVDFYEEGGVGNIVPFDIPHGGGQTLSDTLGLAAANSSQVDFIQLVTWNDFGEGTVFEPTVETGFDYLVQLQEFSGTPFGQGELDLIYRLYLARKAYASDTLVQQQLDQASSLLAELRIDDAVAILRLLDPTVASSDFGDAPQPYPTRIRDDGASHLAVGPRLGPARDGEIDGTASASADGDDNRDSSDEDGVHFGGIQVAGTLAAVNILLENAGSAKVDAWIDFDRDGAWAHSERILDSVTVSNAMQTLNYNLPTGVTAGDTFARVRLSTDGNLAPTGPAPDGEVEDYLVTIVSPPVVDSVVINHGHPQRSSVDAIAVTFDRVVDIDTLNGDPFQFANVDLAVMVTAIPAVSESNNRTVVEFTFAEGPSVTSNGGLVDGSYRFTIDASLVTHFGVPLDGNKDGAAGDSYIFGDGGVDEFFRKYGDSNGNGLVDLLDFAEFRRTFGKSAGDMGYHGSLDSDQDHTIGLVDFAAFRRNFGTSA